MLAVGTPTLVVTVVEMILAMISAVVSFYARVKGAPHTRTINAIRFGLSVFYVGAYIVLLANPGSRLQWSQIMQGVGMITWPAVWIFPGLTSVVNGRRQPKVGAHDG